MMVQWKGDPRRRSRMVQPEQDHHSSPRAWLPGLVLLLLLPPDSALAAPQPGWEPPTIGSPGWRLPSAGPDDPSVARVGEVAIPLSAVRRQLALSSPGTTPAAALSQLIDLELLAQAAVQRGVNNLPTVHDAWKQAAVQRLLELDFEPGVLPARIPEEVLREAFQKNFSFFNRPERRTVCHLLIRVKKQEPEAAWEAARTRLEQIRTQLLASPIPSREVFLERSQPFVTDPRTMTAEDLGEIARSGPMVAEFSAAAFAIGADHELSPPVRTEYGWHLIYRYGTLPELRQPFEQAQAEVRQKTWPEWRQLEFERFLRKLTERHKIWTENLNEARLPTAPLSGIP